MNEANENETEVGGLARPVNAHRKTCTVLVPYREQRVQSARSETWSEEVRSHVRSINRSRNRTNDVSFRKDSNHAYRALTRYQEIMKHNMELTTTSTS